MYWSSLLFIIMNEPCHSETVSLSNLCFQDAKKAEGWLCRMAKAGVKADAVSYCTMPPTQISF